MHEIHGDCTLCGQEDEELTHLDLYVIGSEGIKVCLSCRMILTTVAREIQASTNRAYLRGLRKGKKLHG